MVGMRSDDEILKAFAGLENVPGSKQPRRAISPTPKKAEEKSWDASPIIKQIGGQPTEVFKISALAEALGKSVVTVRQWETRGYIPSSPYRLRQKVLNGMKTAGNRVYTRELVEATIDEFQKRGLLGKARVEWKEHPDLTTAIYSRWDRIVNGTYY